MKIALVSDIHFGCRGDSLVFLDYTKKFIDKVFFPALEKHGVKGNDIIIAGDLVDRRKYINFNTAVRIQDDFLSKLKGAWVLPGNHDCYHKDNNEVNALEVLCRDPKFIVVDEPCEYRHEDGTSILMVPWISPENQERVMEAIQKSTADICIGHFELQGFTMYPGMVCSHGMSPSVLSKFKLVVSGHFHSTSRKGNVLYLGSPLQITWNDYGDPRGFYILDTCTFELNYIQNPIEMFHKVVYDDTDKSMEQVLAWDFDKFQDAFVKVIVRRKTNPYWFDLFIEKLDIVATDVKVVEVLIDKPEEEMNLIEGCEDTTTILRKYVRKSEAGVNKDNLENLIVSLYNEAIQMGVQ